MVANSFLRVDKGENVLEVCTRLSVVRYHDLNEFDCFHVVKMSLLVECCLTIGTCMIYSATYKFLTSNMYSNTKVFQKISEWLSNNFSTLNAMVMDVK